MTPQERNEECRRAVRHYLAARPGIALTAEAIQRGLSRHGWDIPEVKSALHFFVGLKPAQVDAEHEPLGSTLYYQITTDGILADERGQ